MFQDTLDIVDACDLTYLHVFPFSPRPGTPAARMPQVAATTVKQRAARLRAKGDVRLQQFLEKQVGREVDVLMERPHIGRTPQFAEVRFNEPTAIGAIIRTKIAATDGRRLLAETAS